VGKLGFGARANHISDRAKKIADARDVNFALSFVLCTAAENANDFARWNPRRDVIYFGMLDGPIAIDDEHYRLGNAALFLGIINTPFLNHPPFCIAQNRKGELQLAPHCFGFDWRIDAHGHNVGPGRAYFLVMIAVIRQLAKTEWSPIAAIEDKRQTASRNQFR
jgi:hypothetical protein